MSNTDDQVIAVERYLEARVTQTPLETRFTAADMAAFLSADVADVSQWLQRYRDVQGNLTMSTAEYVIATTDRGARSEWFILKWPDMTRGQRTTAAVLLSEHEIMSLVREDIAPMIRNLKTQFIPAAVANRAIMRPLAQVNLTKVNGYRTMVLEYQRELIHLHPTAVRRQAAALNGVLTTTLNELDLVKLELVAI